MNERYIEECVKDAARDRGLPIQGSGTLWFVSPGKWDERILSISFLSDLDKYHINWEAGHSCGSQIVEEPALRDALASAMA